MKRAALRKNLMLFCLGLGFLAALAWIFSLQFSGGGSYPPGSSLRADPQGTMILFESLQRQPELKVERNLRPLKELDVEAEDTLLVLLNVSNLSLRQPEVKAFVQAGGQVLAQPRPRGNFLSSVESGEESSEDVDAEEILELFINTEDLLPRSEVPPAQANTLEAATQSWVSAERVLVDAAAPEVIDWREGGIFRDVPGEVLYRQRNLPVLTRVEDGQGSWWILADGALLQNGAMYAHRESEWLAWLFAGRRHIIFEETHLGIEEARGVMTLIRRFGLLPFLLSLFLPLGLLIWRGMIPFLPALPDDQDTEAVSLSRLDGYRDLLTRHIPAAQLPKLLFKTWREDAGEGQLRRMGKRLQEAETLSHTDLPQRGRMEHLRNLTASLHRLLHPRTRKNHE